MPIYSLLVQADEVVAFDDLPAAWTRTNDLTWPESATRPDHDD
ncbi:hypothetical protein ACLMAL_25175 [Nocardia sp. CWNU-33]